ncbi:MAG TPA: type II secretion system protein GspG [Pyrinomonadaceae bacterium]|nr:type II secretion system protein GspG [Pyrinomonadaceae bacterium]
MRHTTRRTTLTLCLSAVLCAHAAWSVCVVAASVVAAATAAEKAIKRNDARKLIAAASLLELNNAAVTIKEISPPGTVSTVLASVRLGFHFTKDAKGAWRVVEVRTGDRRWESFDLLARAAGGDTFLAARAELDALAAELAALGAQKRASGKDENEPPKELRRGALSVKNPASALSGSSAVVELEIETSVDFQRDARGRWQVARVSVGGRSFDAFEAFERALDTEKRERARADLETLSAALEAYRRARGFYVAAETSADLVNHLNPGYTTAYIRVDPWHRPYEYAGTRERFTLRSLGADGKPNTPDDVTIGKQ